jgi:hypothetical protein
VNPFVVHFYFAGQDFDRDPGRISRSPDPDDAAPSFADLGGLAEQVSSVVGDPD